MSNPPPIRIPLSFTKDREVASFFERLTRDIYQIWDTSVTGVSGVIDIASGGTGATSASQARDNLDLYSTTETETEIKRYALLVN